MSKDAYYFPHDSNAKDDPKCVMLIEQLGMEGYGIYWMLIETLRDQPEYKYPVALLPALARRYNTTPEKVKTVVGNYGLFVIEGDVIFFSQSLNNRMLVFEKKREQNRIAGRKSAEKRLLASSNPTGVQHPFNERSTSKVNKSKVKGRKDIGGAGGKRTTFSPPSISEISEFISENGYTVDAQQFIDHYTANGWMVGKNKMRDWKAAVRNWDRRNAAEKPVSEIPFVNV